MESYLACLDDEEKALGDAATDEQKKVHTAQHNAAVDALNAVAARYNEQVQIFKKQASRAIKGRRSLFPGVRIPAPSRPLAGIYAACAIALR